MSNVIADSDFSSSLRPESRRKLRRVRMIVDLTSALIGRDSSLTCREARSLIDCAEKAVIELVPEYRATFDGHIRPLFERIIRQRWPLEVSLQHSFCPRELVN